MGWYQIVHVGPNEIDECFHCFHPFYLYISIEYQLYEVWLRVALISGGGGGGGGGLQKFYDGV